jgi:hypothetical protein
LTLLSLPLRVPAIIRRPDESGQPTRAWTDLNQSDPGVALLELLAYLADALASYQDAIAAEQHLRTRRYALGVGALGLVLLVWWWTRDGTNDD